MIPQNTKYVLSSINYAIEIPYMILFNLDSNLLRSLNITLKPLIDNIEAVAAIATSKNDSIQLGPSH